MRFVEVAAFDVCHKHLPWPWVCVDPGRAWFAFLASRGAIAARALVDGALVDGPTFALPADLAPPSQKPSPSSHRGPERGLHAIAIDPRGARVALTASVDGVSHVVTLDAGGELRRSRVDALLDGDYVAHAITFDRAGARLFVSAERDTETAVALLDAETHAVIGVVTSKAFPPPAAHELHAHPVDDAVLLLAACGQDGTFARVCGFTDASLVAIETALDDGGESAGLVGFSADGARVHLAGNDALRTHAWPTLTELSSVAFDDDFVSNFSGAVIGPWIYVDGEDADTGDDDAVMRFDRSAIRGTTLSPPCPAGMWVGRLGADHIVTVEAKGEPARGRVLRITEARDA